MNCELLTLKCQFKFSKFKSHWFLFASIFREILYKSFKKCSSQNKIRKKKPIDEMALHSTPAGERTRIHFLAVFICIGDVRTM